MGKSDTSLASYSLVLYILYTLQAELGEGSSFRRAYDFPGHEKESWALLGVEHTRNMKGPFQDLEFVAKRLLWGEGGDGPVLLGTPPYVAS